MPLYEYHCSKCGKNFDVIQKFSDAPLTTHEECGGQVEKLMSAPSFHLKGGGWYVTEYGKGGKVPAPESSEGKADDKKSKSGASSESKSNGSSSSETKSTSSSDSGSKSESSSSAESKPASTPAKSD
jgi:putative FmdB family regulatory protein